MTQEALKLALEALENNRKTHYYCEDPWYSCPKDEDGCANESEGDECNCGADKANAEIDKTITAIKEALAQTQEPVAWQTMEAKYPTLEKLDIRMGDGSILCSVWPQSDGDLWWEGSGTGEKFIDPKYANVTHWRVHSDTTPPQRTEQEPVAIKRMKEWIEYLKRKSDFGQHMKIPSEMSAGTCWELAIELEQFINTTPPQRTWQGLTDEEIAQGCKESWVTEQAWQSAVWWAEDKLKEKNT